METYDFCLNHLDFSGPTLFAPILREIIGICHASKSNLNEDKYFTFLILTDGIINDMSETQKLLESCAELPVSVVIVGVGESDFE